MSTVTLAVVPCDASRWTTTQPKQSPYFKLLSVPASQAMTVHFHGALPGTSLTLFQDLGGGQAEGVMTLTDGMQISYGSLLLPNLRYFFGNVVGGPRCSFVVSFTMPASAAVIALHTNLDNTQAFVSSLFLPSLRSVETVLAAATAPNPDYATGLYVAPFADADSIERILTALTNQWLHGSATGLSTSDANLINTLKSYVSGTTLWLPLLAFTGWSGAVAASPPIYELQSYEGYNFGTSASWNQDTIRRFLTLFLFGAHFVTMQDSGVTGALPDFMGHVTTDVSSSLKTGVTDSHYTSPSLWGVAGAVHSSGVAYPSSISGDTIPSACPLLPAFLMGPTVQNGVFTTVAANARESFFQLEGWQSNGSLSGRHMTDYDSYNATLWNFSTYGASAYSEKRGTTVFIGPAGWTPVVDPASIMAPYLGANPTQDWMQQNLVWVSAYPTQKIAAIGLSESAALPSENHRSGPDFYIDTTVTGTDKSVTCYFSGHPNPSAITVKLQKPDGTNHPLTHGASFSLSGNHWDTGTYYLSDPSGAIGGAFLVLLMHNS